MILETGPWRLELPEGIVGRLVDPHPELQLREMAVARGWFGDHAVIVIVSWRDAGGLTLRGRCLSVSEMLRENRSEGVEIDVAGATGARRVDGTVAMEEGVSPDGLERWTIVVAGRGRREHVTLTVRVPAAPDLSAGVDALVAGFSVHRGAVSGT